MIDKKKLKEAWKLFEKTKVIHMITFDGDNFFCRPMSGVLADEEVILAATFRSSKKVAQAGKFGKAAIFLYDPETHHYACLSGTAKVADDKAGRKKLWHEDWGQYYKDGIDDKEYVYIKLKVENIDYVTNV